MNDAQAATYVRGTFSMIAASEGEWGERMRVRVDFHTRPLTPAEAPGTLFNLTIRDTWRATPRDSSNVSVEPNHARFVTRVLQLESQLVRTTAVGAIGTRRNPRSGEPG